MFTIHINHVVTKSMRSSLKEVIHAIGFINLRASGSRESRYYETNSKERTTKSILERLNCSVVTVTRCLQNPTKRKPPSDRGLP